jgi:hypothetical protein
MTMTLEQHIEELRAELRLVSDVAERCEIALELELALAELMVMLAEQSGEIEPGPPF